MAKETDSELIARINHEIATADYEGQSEISGQRGAADLAYTSQYTEGVYPETGMSSVLINTLQPTVDTLTTYMSKVFNSDHETVVFNGDRAEVTDFAKEATEAVNHVIHKENPGYTVLSRWFKDAALHKNGIVKVVWDNAPIITYREYEDIDEELILATITQLEEKDFEVEVEKHEEYEEGGNKITLKITESSGRPRIFNIPPEEFLINEGATSINDDEQTRFVTHRKLYFKADVLRMFPHVDVTNLSQSQASGYLEHEYEKDIRHHFDGTYDQNDYTSSDPLLAQVELRETWIRDTENDYGWLHCFSVGNELLSKEPWGGPIPMCSFTYWPIPHKFYGLGAFDKLFDYHIAKTNLFRALQDSATQASMTRFIADPTTINIRDLKSGKPGIIRSGKAFDPSSIFPLQTQGADTNGLIAALNYLDKEVIAQTGIDPVSGAVSADVEKSGNDADKTAMAIDNASAKIEGYAREFAETGLKDAIWIIYNLLVDNGYLPEVGMSSSDLAAKVGLGHMTMAQKARNINAIQARQDLLSAPVEAGGAGIVIQDKYKLASAAEMSKSLGYENTNDFFPPAEESDQLKQAIEQARQQGMQEGMAQAQENIEMQKTAAEAQYKNAQTDEIYASIPREDAKAINDIVESDAEIELESEQQRPVEI